MRQATHSSLRFAMLALAACLAVPAAAGTHILSGTFDGSESALPPLTLAAACYSVPVSLAPQGLQQVELRVSESGSYTLRDIAWYSWHYHGAKVTVYLYQGRFRADLAPLEGSGTYGDTYHLVAGGGPPVACAVHWRIFVRRPDHDLGLRQLVGQLGLGTGFERTIQAGRAGSRQP